MCYVAVKCVCFWFFLSLALNPLEYSPPTYFTHVVERSSVTIRMFAFWITLFRNVFLHFSRNAFLIWSWKTCKVFRGRTMLCTCSDHDIVSQPLFFLMYLLTQSRNISVLKFYRSLSWWIKTANDVAWRPIPCILFQIKNNAHHCHQSSKCQNKRTERRKSSSPRVDHGKVSFDLLLFEISSFGEGRKKSRKIAL